LCAKFGVYPLTDEQRQNKVRQVSQQVYRLLEPSLDALFDAIEAEMAGAAPGAGYLFDMNGVALSEARPASTGQQVVLAINVKGLRFLKNVVPVNLSLDSGQPEFTWLRLYPAGRYGAAAAFVDAAEVRAAEGEVFMPIDMSCPSRFWPPTPVRTLAGAGRLCTTHRASTPPQRSVRGWSTSWPTKLSIQPGGSRSDGT
jgi:hypothetical protein